MGSPTMPAAYAAGYSTVFQTQHIAPPNAIYFSPDDQLFLFVVPSVVCTLRIVVRYLLPTGELKVGEYDVTTVATRSPQLQIQNLGEGFILGINVYCHTAALRRGQVWVKFVLVRGGLNTQILSQTICQGYVTQYTSLFFPEGPKGYELEGRGNIRSITGTTPGVGLEITETVPAGAVWRVISFNANFTSSATVANRQPTLTYTDGTNLVAMVTVNALVPASNAMQLHLADGFPYSAVFNGIMNMPLPRESYLPAGFQIKTNTFGIQVGDQWNVVQYLVEEWLQP